VSLLTISKEGYKHDEPRFPHMLQSLRLARPWKQNDLAAHLGINPRTYISWEKGDRIPPLVMVVLLSWVLETSARSDLLAESQLLRAYTMDELTRQAQRGQGNHVLAREALMYMMQGSDDAAAASDDREPVVVTTLEQLMENQFQPPLRNHPTQEQEENDSGNLLRHFFALLEVLRRRPDLITVVEDFLNQMAGE
jgi:transcriptional regulator with XRE-family HTH domain